MQDLEALTIEEYNAEPVYYCPHCLSLKIMPLDGVIDYCDECGYTEIETCQIEEWQEMYKNRFKGYNPKGYKL